MSKDAPEIIRDLIFVPRDASSAIVAILRGSYGFNARDAKALVSELPSTMPHLNGEGPWSKMTELGARFALWQVPKSFVSWDRGKVFRVRLRMPTAESARGPNFAPHGMGEANQLDPSRFMIAYGRPSAPRKVVQANIFGLPGLTKGQPSRTIRLDDGRMVPLRMQDLGAVQFLMDDLECYYAADLRKPGSPLAVHRKGR